MLIIGLDPGKAGSIAVLYDDGRVCAVIDAPLVPVGKRREYDLAACADLLRAHVKGTLLAIEQVGVRPGEGTVASFSFGMGFGIWLGIAAAFGLRIERVTPQRWKKAMLAGLPQGKGSSIQRAKELFPDQAARLARVKDHGRADALLIAEFARRTFATRSAEGGEHGGSQAQGEDARVEGRSLGAGPLAQD